MGKILTQIQDKNGVVTRRWMNAETSARQLRLSRMMGAAPTQPMTFTKHQIATAKLDHLTRYIDEAVVKNRLDDFILDFAQHPQLPALYQTLFYQQADSPELGDALLENPNVSVGTVEHYYTDSQSALNFFNALTHPLLPIEHAIDGYNDDVYEDIIRTRPAWAQRAEAQNDRVKIHLGSRP